jgi:3-oxoacyl-[acyl-carrier protein] reductase
VVGQIIDQGGHALAVQVDIADTEAVQRAFSEVERSLGQVDVIVNAAGLMLLSTVVDLELDDPDRMHRTNIRGTFVIAQQAARRPRAGGAIINFSSTVTRLSIRTYAGYTASKAAVDALTLILARELRGRDITVNAVAPGPTATALFFACRSDEDVARAAANSPLERLGTPEDVAELVAFLAGPGHCGHVLCANGGVA